MTERIKCFLLTPTATAEHELRRYSMGACPSGFGYHNAETFIGVIPFPIDDTNGTGNDDHPHDDPRWPAKCACGYEFKPEDSWQNNVHRLHARDDGGPATTWEKAPAGAMWFADYLPAKGPDGRALVVMLPHGMQWHVDGGSQQGRGWQRSGEPPNVTATPSILASQGTAREYHGFLTAGYLVKC